MKELNRCWVEIDLGVIAENFSMIRRRVENQAKIMAIVKADGYGHGAMQVASLLEGKGADFFGVATLQEGIELRKGGIQKPILILGITAPEFYGNLLRYDLSQTIANKEQACQLSAFCAAEGAAAKVHIALDTGMGRLGFDAFDTESVAKELCEVAALKGIIIEGMYSHFSVADTDGEEVYTQEQFERFDEVRRLLAEREIFPICHIANTAGILAKPEYHLDMVRAGIALYGQEPGGRENPFHPAMVLKARISFIKDLPAGRSVSYGRRFQSDRPLRVATLPIGYGDGYPRALSGKGYALIGGKKAPILGMVCMDMMMVDVSDIPCKAGDEAILMGGGIDFQEVAAELKTIHYELICGFSKRVPRIYKEERI